MHINVAATLLLTVVLGVAAMAWLEVESTGGIAFVFLVAGAVATLLVAAVRFLIRR